MKTSELIGNPLAWAVAVANGNESFFWANWDGKEFPETDDGPYRPDLEWSQGGSIIERENITLIRANNQYIEGKYVPLWFAETDKWVGHNITTGYEGEYFDPCFMIDEAGGCYGPTPLIAAMRCYVASKLGNEVEIPEELS